MPTNFSPQYSVVIFNDGDVIPARKYRMLDEPSLYAEKHGGVFETVLVSKEGFKNLFGHPPEAPATAEEKRALRADSPSGRSNKRKSPTRTRP